MPGLEVGPPARVAVPRTLRATLLVVAHARVPKANRPLLTALAGPDNELLAALGVTLGAIASQLPHLVTVSVHGPPSGVCESSRLQHTWDSRVSSVLRLPAVTAIDLDLPEIAHAGHLLAFHLLLLPESLEEIVVFHPFLL